MELECVIGGVPAVSFMYCSVLHLAVSQYSFHRALRAKYRRDVEEFSNQKTYYNKQIQHSSYRRQGLTVSEFHSLPLSAVPMT